MQTDILERDGGVHLRTAWWEPPGDCSGDLLLLNGRTEFVEKYDESARHLTDQGWRVWSLDWRGQGRSTHLLANAEKGHIDDYATHVADLRTFVAWVIRRGGAPRHVLAHSMGGHITLRYLIDTPDHPFERAVFSAPMVAPHFAPWQAVMAPVLARLAMAVGCAGCYALFNGDWKESDQTFDDNKLTHDEPRFMEVVNILRKQPELRLGGVTCGWLAATLRSVNHIHAPGRPESLGIPCMVLQAAEDRIVSNRRMNAFFARVPHARMEPIAGARHEIMRETDDKRATFWRHADAFLAG